MAVQYWLFKSEPEEFSLDDFQMAPAKTTYWDGVRNYQARNFIRDNMKKGDKVLFYQSNTEPLAVVGTCIIVTEAYPDFTQFDPEHKHYDAGSTPETPRWFMVDIRFEKKFKTPVTLEQMRNTTALQGMRLLQRGNRLSVMPVTEEEWHCIISLGTAKSNR